MTLRFQEGELHFDFHGCVSVEKLDRQGVSAPHGMKLVDFLVEETRRTLLVEVKDPSQIPVPKSERSKFVKKLQGKELINHELVPKYRDSYCFLHLMEQDSKPFLLIVVLGTDALPTVGPVELLECRRRLLARLRKECDRPWKYQYVADCVVLTEATWPRHFPSYPLHRGDSPL
ncbi:hypothetical protein J7M28_02505 [bacterium]|nr:hypothetical protein [bacterium]